MCKTSCMCYEILSKLLGSRHFWNIFDFVTAHFSINSVPII